MKCLHSGCDNDAKALSNFCASHGFDGKDRKAASKDPHGRVDELERALRNVQLLACRELARKEITPERSKEMWTHALRFCREVGIEPSVLRNADQEATRA